MHIRATAREDIPAIVNLYRDVAQVPGGLARLADEITRDYVDAFVQHALNSGIALVAESADKQIVGELHASCSNIFCFSHVLTDLTVAVSTAHRKQGIARKLFAAMFTELQHSCQQITRVELIARESNAHALAFYESLGFVREGRLEGRIKNLDGSTEADIPMAWRKPRQQPGDLLETFDSTDTNARLTGYTASRIRLTQARQTLFMNKQQSQPNWRFDNSYLKLPAHAFARLQPEPVREPRLVVFNADLAAELGLAPEGLDGNSGADELAELLSGNRLPEGAEPIAQAYAGHQFGYFAKLGDGRALLLGEHLTPTGIRVDIQLKGSGRTPYSRMGDGRAALGPMLREHIMAEAMHVLGISTARSLAVVSTGEPVYRESALPGAILTRVAASHLRVGTFEYFAGERDLDSLKQLADYAINRHDPELQDSDRPYLDFFQAVMRRQIELVVDWLRVGFIHGVMNTDNMTISGETIDYGPCAFMDSYDPQTVFSSIDHGGRYAFANQPHIVKWNLARLGESLLPLLHEDVDQAATLANALLESFDSEYQHAWLAMMRSKLGLTGEQDGDEEIIDELLQWMQQHKADYTNTFRDLVAGQLPSDEQYQNDEFITWHKRWQQRRREGVESLTAGQEMMRQCNPVLIPRNHRVEAALAAAENEGDFSVLKSLLEALRDPYADDDAFADYRQPPAATEQVRQTFCGT